MKKRMLLTALLVIPMAAFAQQGTMPSGLSNTQEGLWEKDSQGQWVLKTPQGGWKQGGVQGFGSGGTGPKQTGKFNGIEY